MLAQEITKRIQEGSLSCVEACEQSLQAISKNNSDLNAVIEVNAEQALSKAKQIDAGDKKGKLVGVPVLVKDNFCVKGFNATAGSKILGNFKPPYTAFCIQRLIDEGAIIVGKTNLDEFAMGSSNENSAYGVCKNPWNTDYVPGGSSGGSAVAVASKMSPLSIGSDTGGSIRQPASFCGVVGVKPTYGSVSRYGMIAFASSLDQAGPFAQTVSDAKLALEVMIGNDPKDGTNVGCDFDFSKKAEKQYTIGLPKQYIDADLSKDLRSSIDTLITELKKSGHKIVEIDLPHTSYAIPVYYLVASSEASSNLSRYDGVRYGVRDINLEGGRPVNDLKEFYKLSRTRGFGDEVKRRILIGTFSLSSGYYEAFYTKACQVRRLIANDFVEAFQSCDFILGPVTTGSAFKIAEKIDDPIAMYNNDILTTPASLAGLPSTSLPLGLDGNKLPLGLQIIAPSFADDRMLAFAEMLEQIIDFKGGPDVG